MCVFVFQGLTNPLGKPVCSFDPEGLIFAAGVESQAIKLYDLRAFDKVKCKLVCAHVFIHGGVKHLAPALVFFSLLYLIYNVFHLFVKRVPLPPSRQGLIVSVTGLDSNSATTANRFSSPPMEG